MVGFGGALYFRFFFPPDSCIHTWLPALASCIPTLCQPSPQRFFASNFGVAHFLLMLGMQIANHLGELLFSPWALSKDETNIFFLFQNQMMLVVLLPKILALVQFPHGIFSGTHFGIASVLCIGGGSLVLHLGHLLLWAFSL